MFRDGKRWDWMIKTVCLLTTDGSYAKILQSIRSRWKALITIKYMFKAEMGKNLRTNFFNITVLPAMLYIKGRWAVTSLVSSCILKFKIIGNSCSSDTKVFILLIYIFESYANTKREDLVRVYQSISLALASDRFVPTSKPNFSLWILKFHWLTFQIFSFLIFFFFLQTFALYILE